MVVQFGSRTYLVNFQHHNKDCEPGERSTTCTIVEQVPGSRDGHEVGYGIAYCHHKDNYVKERGRKLALTRALQAFPDLDNYEFRKAVWAAYFARYEQQAELRRQSRVDWQAQLRRVA